MKIKILSLLIVFIVGTCISPQKTDAQRGVISLQIFYDDLSPYGTWIDNPEYGYVWFPNVQTGFTPYSTNGYWILTDEGWAWVSNYSWGWAPFHYGRWFIDDMYGAMWIPGNEWGPGWVDWRTSGDYYGWAPLGPDNRGYNTPNNQWRFVPCRDLGRKDIHNYYTNSSNNIKYINNSRVLNNNHFDKIHNVTYNAGPDRNEVEKHIGRAIKPIAIKEISQRKNSLNKNLYQVYRPQVQKNNLLGTKPAPSRVANIKDVKTSKPEPNRLNNQHPAKIQQNNQPVKQQPAQQHTFRPVIQQPARQQQNNQPVRQQPVQQQQNNRPENKQPIRQQPVQQQHTVRPVNQQPVRNQQANPPVRQQPVQQQQNNRPENKQSHETRQNDPSNNNKKEREQH